MWKKIFAVSVAAIGAVAVFCNGNAFASYTSESYTPGEKKSFYSGDIDVCVSKTGGYTGDTIVANVSDGHFDTQLNFDSFSENEKCKSLTIPSSGDTNYVSYYTPMGLGNLNLDEESLGTSRKIKLNLSSSTKLSKYIGSNGSFDNRIGASKIEIQFDTNGGIGTMPAMTNLDPDTSIVLDSNSFTRVDYKFVGWNTAADGSGTSYIDGDTVNFADGGIVRLYAQWVPSVATLLSGGDFNEKLKMLAGASSSVHYYTPDRKIKSFIQAPSLPTGFDTEDSRYIISSAYSLPKIYAWFDDTDYDNDGVGDGIIYWYSDADKIYMSSSSDRMFEYMQALTSLTIPDIFDASKVTNMSDMFRNASSLTTLTLPNTFDTSKVKNMSSMFEGASSLTTLTLPDSFDTSSVTNMGSMFYMMSSLSSLTLPSAFNTSNVTSMSNMFYGVSRLTTLTLPAAFDTTNVTNMYSMFYMMSGLSSLTLPAAFNTLNVTNMNSMFGGMTSLTSLTLPNTFDTSNVTNMRGMFRFMTSLTSLTFSTTFNTSNVTDMSEMFENTNALTTLTLPATFNTSSVTTMYRMFGNMSRLTSLTFPTSFNTSSVTNMEEMFTGMQSMTSLTLPNSFNTSSVTYMKSMFYNMSSLTTLTLPNAFVISSGAYTTSIFYNISNTATLYAADATARSLWPGVLGN